MEHRYGFLNTTGLGGGTHTCDPQKRDPKGRSSYRSKRKTEKKVDSPKYSLEPSISKEKKPCYIELSRNHILPIRIGLENNNDLNSES